jgi:hypothetical protein
MALKLFWRLNEKTDQNNNTEIPIYISKFNNKYTENFPNLTNETESDFYNCAKEEANNIRKTNCSHSSFIEDDILLETSKLSANEKNGNTWTKSTPSDLYDNLAQEDNSSIASKYFNHSESIYQQCLPSYAHKHRSKQLKNKLNKHTLAKVMPFYCLDHPTKIHGSDVQIHLSIPIRFK